MEYIYICSPHRSQTVKEAGQHKIIVQGMCRKVVEAGFVPIAPHLYFPQFLNDSEAKERDLGINIGIELVRICTEMWVYKPKISAGMEKEIEIAKSKGIKIKYIENT